MVYDNTYRYIARTTTIERMSILEKSLEDHGQCSED